MVAVTSLYQRIGVRPIINANTTLTRLGGSVMPLEVSAAMAEASRSFVDMFELQRAVSARIAELTRNEAAHVSGGASAGLFLATLACITGNDMVAVGRHIRDPLATERRDIVVLTGQRNPYDLAIQLAGARLTQVGNLFQTFAWEIEAAITDRTAAIFYFAGPHLATGSAPLATVIDIGHAHGLPVVVDAAAQLPPPDNLWRFTGMGADVVLFSGGKGLRGPQSSGLILGRTDLIEACRLHSSPHQRLGRPMKVSREDLVGVLVALERFLELDHDAVLAAEHATVDRWVADLGAIPHLSVRKVFPGEAGTGTPRARLDLDPSLGRSASSVAEELRQWDPPIDVGIDGEWTIFLTAMTLQEGEEGIVSRALISLLTRTIGRDG
jgi:L-seryl-tRNA(Ser) seleniumtransferase